MNQIIVRQTVQSMFSEQTLLPVKNRLYVKVAQNQTHHKHNHTYKIAWLAGKAMHEQRVKQ